MIQMLRARRRSDEKGFTLIELMVVVLIIAILIAIAIPAFLGARKKAQDKEAQSNLRNALAAQKVVFSEDQTFTATSDTLEDEEPSLNYLSTASGLGSNNVLVAIDTTQTVGTGANEKHEAVLMAAYSKSHKCYYLYEHAQQGTFYLVVDDGIEDPADCNRAASSGTASMEDNADDGW